MSDYFQAVALDYDGTIAHGGPPAPSILEALAIVRSSACRTLLVTGRIHDELIQEFPDAHRHFDAIVVENGAVVYCAGRPRCVASPVPEALERALHARGVPARRGRVILATLAQHDRAVLEACAELGLDHHLVRNRGELMVLPAGISKGTGVREALAELGLSHHNAVGIGDAENDIALLESCEVGVAVANAVSSLKQRADVVLEGSTEVALPRFLREDLVSGLSGIRPRRQRIELGLTADGGSASLPTSRVQVFIDGPTGAGKSYLAGLFAEGLIAAGYSLCVLDLEGDHAELGHLRGVLTLGGREPLPSLDEVARFVRHRFGSLVLDLSMRDAALKYAYARDVLDRLTEERRSCGLPHWIFIEEAHAVPSDALDRAREHGSLCLVTYHPDWLPASTLGASDIRVTVEGPGRARIDSGDGRSVVFQPAGREVQHVRHRHKYAEASVPYDRGFTFRDESGAVGLHVVSLAEFSDAIARVPAGALAHHARNRDFSRWIRDVFRDLRLAALVQRSENGLQDAQIELFRTTVRELIALRYGLPADEDGASQAEDVRNVA